VSAAGKIKARGRLIPVVYLSAIAMCSLLSRVVFSPLLPAIEDDLALTHGEAGSIFFYTSFGFSVGMLCSGFISRVLTHRFSIFCSTLTAGVSLVAVSLCPSLGCMRVVLFILGAGTGLYMPSAMATITSLVKKEQRGRAIAINEVGFNMSFVVAPLLGRALLPYTSWRFVTQFIAVMIVSSGVVFILFGEGGTDRGSPPHLKHIRKIIVQPSFWIITLLFALAIGGEIGVFSMIPTYMVKEKLWDQEFVNTLIGISRLSCIFSVFVTGWLVDHIGIKPLIRAVFGIAGVVTAIMGFADGILLVVAVFVQPLVIICFFPAGLSAIAALDHPELLSLTTSLIAPSAYLIGAGLVPAGMALLGDQGAFSAGFFITGGALLAALVPIHFLTLTGEKDAAEKREEPSS
jgi:NNP family nitrate/nitrite transporter-like MFS transporter